MSEIEPVQSATVAVTEYLPFHLLSLKRQESFIGIPKETDFFVVNLSDEDDFDEALFDLQMRMVAKQPDDKIIPWEVKFMVFDDQGDRKMVVFPVWQWPGAMIKAMPEAGVKGRIRCAGYIQYNFTNRDLNMPRRRIWDYQDPVKEIGGPSLTESNVYVQIVLRSRLSQHFAFDNQ